MLPRPLGCKIHRSTTGASVNTQSRVDLHIASMQTSFHQVEPIECNTAWALLSCADCLMMPPTRLFMMLCRSPEQLFGMCGRRPPYSSSVSSQSQMAASKGKGVQQPPLVASIMLLHTCSA